MEPRRKIRQPNVFLLYLVLVVIMPWASASASSLSFNLSPPYDSNSINTTGSCNLSDDGIDCDGTSGGVGRALYSQPFKLSEGADLANFSTHFVFSIEVDESETSCNPGGLTFFLAPLADSSPDDLSQFSGAGLGLSLPSLDTTTTPSSSPFIAVEFDAYGGDYFDPSYQQPHVGIDLESLESNTTVPWTINFTAGTETEVWINYDSNSQLLAAEFTDSDANQVSVNTSVNLIDYLQKFVSVGFSASSATCSSQIIRVKTWDFSSKLLDDIDLSKLIPPYRSPPNYGDGWPTNNFQPVVIPTIPDNPSPAAPPPNGTYFEYSGGKKPEFRGHYEPSTGNKPGIGQVGVTDVGLISLLLLVIRCV